MPPKRIAPLADNLTDTLRAEAEALDELKLLFEQQLDALRDGDTDALGETATKAQECAAVLENKRQEAERQARLLGRLLGTSEEVSLREVMGALEARLDETVCERLTKVRTAVEDRAQKVNQRSETLSFALQYAADLNHELLAAMKGTAEEEDVHTYTSTGQAEPRQLSGDPSFVNTIG